MLKELIKKYGKDKINTFTKYPSILTFHKLGDKGKLTNEFTTELTNEFLYATEKVDGTNARIVCYGDEFLIGARESILHHSDDLYFDKAQDIVEGLRTLGIIPPKTEKLTVIYGEFYGGKTHANAKNYGTDKNGYRVFDVAVYDDLSILEKDLNAISKWRESETSNGIVYGQKFMIRNEFMNFLPNFEFVPEVEFDLGDKSHKTILENLRKYASETKVALSEKALKKVEGVVLRNADRTKIVKLRFEDYEKTLK